MQKSSRRSVHLMFSPIGASDVLWSQLVSGRAGAAPFVKKVSKVKNLKISRLRSQRYLISCLISKQRRPSVFNPAAHVGTSDESDRRLDRVNVSRIETVAAGLLDIGSLAI